MYQFPRTIRILHWIIVPRILLTPPEPVIGTSREPVCVSFPAWTKLKHLVDVHRSSDAGDESVIICTFYLKQQYLKHLGCFLVVIPNELSVRVICSRLMKEQRDTQIGESNTHYNPIFATTLLPTVLTRQIQDAKARHVFISVKKLANYSSLSRGSNIMHYHISWIEWRLLQ